MAELTIHSNYLYLQMRNVAGQVATLDLSKPMVEEDSIKYRPYLTNSYTTTRYRAGINSEDEAVMTANDGYTNILEEKYDFRIDPDGNVQFFEKGKDAPVDETSLSFEAVLENGQMQIKNKKSSIVYGTPTPLTITKDHLSLEPIFLAHSQANS